MATPIHLRIIYDCFEAEIGKFDESHKGLFAAHQVQDRCSPILCGAVLPTTWSITYAKYFQISVPSMQSHREKINSPNNYQKWNLTQESQYLQRVLWNIEI